jgi:hypothetical protein
MLNLEDPIWDQLNGGYKARYNPTKIIKEIYINIESKTAWDEIWEDLHHQGDIGEASYAVIPYFVDSYAKSTKPIWDLYSYISCILIESHRKTNPKAPLWIKNDLEKSLDVLFERSFSDLKSTNDQTTIHAIIGYISLYKGLIKYGALISTYDESEINEYINDTMAWNELYE